MASLASSAVSLYPALGSGGAAVELPLNVESGSPMFRRLKLVLTGQGGATNTVSATALGFSTLLSCSNLFDATSSKVFPAVVDPVNNVILFTDPTQATDADRATPADLTTTAAYITVLGLPFVKATAPV